MEILIATLGRRAVRKHAPAEEMFADYCGRASHFCRCEAENYPTEEKFFDAMERGRGRGPGSSPNRKNFQLILLDSRGRAYSSEQFAEWLRRQQDDGVQRLVFAIGPANGWSDAARARAGMLLSLGTMTLPHELAAVVLTEQVYRAFTIIGGRPYHLGHA